MFARYQLLDERGIAGVATGKPMITKLPISLGWNISQRHAHQSVLRS